VLCTVHFHRCTSFYWLYPAASDCTAWRTVLHASPTSLLNQVAERKWKYTVQHTAQNGQKEVLQCSHIEVCTGLHIEPNIPSIPGIEYINGDVFRSSKYKYRCQLSWLPRVRGNRNGRSPRNHQSRRKIHHNLLPHEFISFPKAHPQ
jgi:hypothetical protein